MLHLPTVFEENSVELLEKFTLSRKFSYSLDPDLLGELAKPFGISLHQGHDAIQGLQIFPELPLFVDLLPLLNLEPLGRERARITCSRVSKSGLLRSSMRSSSLGTKAPEPSRSDLMGRSNRDASKRPSILPSLNTASTYSTQRTTRKGERHLARFKIRSHLPRLCGRHGQATRRNALNFQK